MASDYYMNYYMRRPQVAGHRGRSKRGLLSPIPHKKTRATRKGDALRLTDRCTAFRNGVPNAPSGAE